MGQKVRGSSITVYNESLIMIQGNEVGYANAHMKGMKNTYEILAGEVESKRVWDTWTWMGG
jgi:hypothetical protein